MATIRTFNSIRPDHNRLIPFGKKYPISFVEQKCNQLKRILEPVSGKPASSEVFINFRKRMEKLIHLGYYHPSDAEMYIFESIQGALSQSGVWAEMCCDDLLNGKLLTHEDTLSERVERIKTYREKVALEGMPLLITYVFRSGIDTLIAEIKNELIPDIYTDSELSYKIWTVKSQLRIIQLTHAFSVLDRVYLADGHHRLTAAINMQAQKPQWISALFVSDHQIRIAPYHRVFDPGALLDTQKVLEEIEMHFFLSIIPGNYPYFPDREHRMGMFLQGIWYQLNLKPRHTSLLYQLDVMTLQDKILAPVFGLEDPATDKRLLALSDLQQLLDAVTKNRTLVAFTLYKIGSEKLINRIENNVILPPKSTFITPKVPYGLIFNDIEKNVDSN